MKTSTDRILTTHTGSLPRPKPLIDLILRREKGEAIAADAFEGEVVKAVDSVVAQQVAAGIDVVSDGEMSKPSYTTYIRHRVSGIEMDPRAAEKGRDIMIGRACCSFRTSPASAAISRPCRFPAASATCVTWTVPRSTATWRISKPRRRNPSPPRCS
jgi:hypothetical protein